MKKPATLILLLALLTMGFVFRKKTFIPPGTVKILDRIYFDEAEITNNYWREYLSWIKLHYGDTSNEYYKNLPDTSVWKDANVIIDESYFNNYFSNSAYRNYPVVGITYQQAVDYCKWRTGVVREIFKNQSPNKYFPQEFIYRLPTKQEWETVAQAGYSQKTLKDFEKKKYKGLPRYNATRAKNKSTSSTTHKNNDILAPVYSYWENKYGVWQIFGNVAEMTNENGIAKGGSWKDKEEDVSADKDYSYNGPKSWLGFRCVCEILKE